MGASVGGGCVLNTRILLERGQNLCKFLYHGPQPTDSFDEGDR